MGDTRHVDDATDLDFELRAYRDGDEDSILAVLEQCHADGWGDVAMWHWKHRQRPGFRAEDVRLAVVDGETVGCFHFSLMPVRLEDGLEVLVSVDGDFGVVPERRRAGIPLALIDLTDPQLRERGAVLRGGFTSEELNDRFYNRNFGQVFIPSVTTQFRKILGPGPLMPRVAALGERLLERPRVRAALRRPMTVQLVIDGFPDCHLILAESGFRLERGTAARSDWRLRLPYSVLTKLADGPDVFLKAVHGGFWAGKVRLGGWLRGVPASLGALGRFLLGR